MRFYVTDYYADLRVRAPFRWHRHPGSTLHQSLKVALERVDDRVRVRLLAPRVAERLPHRSLEPGKEAPAALIPVLPRTGTVPRGTGPRGELAVGERLEVRLRRFGRGDRGVDQCIIDALEQLDEALVAESIGRLGPRERAVEVDERPTGHTRVSLRFITPAHIQSRGNVCEELRFAPLISNIRNRLEVICALHGDLPAGTWDRFSALRSMSDSVQRTWSRIRREKWRRDASVGGTHEVEGLIGEVEFEGPVGHFAGTLAAAEELHVGKHTSWGLGRVAVRLGGGDDVADRRLFVSPLRDPP